MVLGIAGISLRNGAATGRFRKASVRHAPTLDTDRHSEVYLDVEGVRLVTWGGPLNLCSDRP